MLDLVFISNLNLIKPEINYCRRGTSLNRQQCSFKSSVRSFLCLINPGVVFWRLRSYSYSEGLLAIGGHVY